MINLYKSLVRTVLTYGFPILMTANEKVWKRLQITQNKAIRAALGMPSYVSVDYIHHQTNIPLIKQYSKDLLQRAISRSQQYEDKISEQLLSTLTTE